MTDEEINVYKMRITQAGVGELTVIMLEMEMQWIQEAMVAYQQKNELEFISCLQKAQGTQVELMNVMNLDNEVAVEVYAVFSFINKQLIQSKIKRMPMDLERCAAMLKRFHASFIEVAKTDTAGQVMQQSEKVYAGLTYGSSGLVESSTGGTSYSI